MVRTILVRHHVSLMTCLAHFPQKVWQLLRRTKGAAERQPRAERSETDSADARRARAVARVNNALGMEPRVVEALSVRNKTTSYDKM